MTVEERCAAADITTGQELAFDFLRPLSGNLPCAAALFADLHWQLHCRDGFGTALFYFIFNLLINQVVNLQLTFMLLLSNYVL